MVRKPAPANVNRRMADLDREIGRVMRAFPSPGLSVVAVQDGRTVLARGYGLRDVEAKLPFTAQTRTVIGSCTKAMTATLAGMLVDEGRLAWDEPIVTYLPWFRLSDPPITPRVTMADLLSHRTGLPGHDRLWYHSTETREQIVRRLAYLPLSADLRVKYQYNGLAYITAALVIERITGQSWEDNLRRRLLEPLGMDTEFFGVDRVQTSDNYAHPYGKPKSARGRPPRIDHYTHTQIAPGGPTCFSAVDMGKWLSFQLALGKIGQTQLVHPDQIKRTHRPHAWPEGVIGYPEVMHGAYGLGWVVDQYRGRHRINHGGGISGFTSFASLLPNEGVAVAVMVNTYGSFIPGIVTKLVYDRLLGLEKTDWTGRAQREVQQQRSQGGKPPQPAIRRRGTQPSHGLGAYVGRFAHPGYGTIEIARRSKTLTAAYHDGPDVLRHFHYDVFEWNEETTGRTTMVQFQTGRDGGIDALTIRMEPAVEPLRFVRCKSDRDDGKAE